MKDNSGFMAANTVVNGCYVGLLARCSVSYNDPRWHTSPRINRVMRLMITKEYNEYQIKCIFRYTLFEWNFYNPLLSDWSTVVSVQSVNGSGRPHCSTRNPSPDLKPEFWSRVTHWTWGLACDGMGCKESVQRRPTEISENILVWSESANLSTALS